MKKIEYINASAGTGKTYELTHRLSDFFCKKNIKPSQVIVSTYTKAAAAEIKERARKVLVENQRYEDAAALDTAAIGTIHGVAQNFINKYWYAIGMSPNQEVMSDDDKINYRNQSLSALFQSEDYSKQREAINRFFMVFTPQKYNGSYNEINPDFWAEDLEKIIGKLSYYGISSVDDSVKASCDEIDKIFSADIEIDESNTYDSLVKANVDAQLLRSKNYGTIIKNCIKSIFELAAVWMKQYADFKKQVGVIDYDDMEKGFLALLDNDLVKNEIAETYKLIMVDEFQDCNPMQLKIFSKLSDIIAEKSPLEQSSIWVGDPKQAIYGFRGSDTDLVNRVARRFPAVDDSANEDGLKQGSLKQSFRTRNSLIQILNGVFRGDIFPEMPEVFSEIGDKDGQIHPVEYWEFDSEPGNGNAPYYDNFARNIKKMVEDGKHLILPKGEKDQLRPIKYKDIAIICRTNAHINNFASALLEEKIPLSAPEKTIGDRAEVQLIYSLLYLSEISLNSEDKNKASNRAHEVASLLKLWCDWSTEEILEDRLKYVKNGGDIWKWQADNKDLAEVFEAVNHVKSLDISQKVTSLILSLGLNDKVKKWGEAETRRQNLITLQNASAEFFSSCSRLGIAPTAVNFQKYVDDKDLSVAKDNDSDAVKIVTYHGSKGLEWPVVFLADLDSSDLKQTSLVNREFFSVKEIQRSDSKDELLPEYDIYYCPSFAAIAATSNSLGPALTKLLKDDVEFSDGIDNSVVYLNAIERLGGEMARLLYVGATRARDYLIIPKFRDDLVWLENLGLKVDSFKARTININQINPTKVKEPEIPGPRARKKTIEEYPYKLQRYKDYLVAVQAENDYKAERSHPGKYNLYEYDPWSEDDSIKYPQPSNLPASDETRGASIYIESISDAIVPLTTQTDDNGHVVLDRCNHATFGTCVHEIFAACPYKGVMSDEEKAKYLETAKHIVRNYGLDRIITDPAALVDSLNDLYVWLTDRYGEAYEIVHEYPFNIAINDKQVMHGEIDLIWRCEKGDVVVDYKNFIDPNGDLVEHSKGAYVAQLKAYKNILEKAGRTVAETLLYYDILGKGAIIRYE